MPLCLPIIFVLLFSLTRAMGESSNGQVSFIIGPLSYQYSWGMIGTNGMSAQAGWRLSSNYLGGILTWGTGNRSYTATIIDPSSYPNYRNWEKKVNRQHFGAGAIWYYEGISLGNIVTIAPGASMGFWSLIDSDTSDNNFGNTFEFGSFRLKTQAVLGRIGFAVEGCAQLGIGRITPQASIGLFIKR